LREMRIRIAQHAFGERRRVAQRERGEIG
jgi:hypothetical protein